MQTNKSSNNKLFIFGIICLSISLSCILYSLYILPFMIWGLSYNVFDIIVDMLAYFEDDFFYSRELSRLIVWLIIFVPGVVAGVITYIISHKIDKVSLGLEPEATETEAELLYREEQTKKELKESAGLSLQILFLMACILVGFVILQIII